MKTQTMDGNELESRKRINGENPSWGKLEMKNIETFTGASEASLTNRI